MFKKQNQLFTERFGRIYMKYGIWMEWWNIAKSTNICRTIKSELDNFEEVLLCGRVDGSFSHY